MFLYELLWIIFMFYVLCFQNYFLFYFIYLYFLFILQFVLYAQMAANSMLTLFMLKLRSEALSKDIFKLRTFSVINAFFGVKFCFIYKISQIYTDLRSLLDIWGAYSTKLGSRVPSGLLLWGRLCIVITQIP